MTKISPTRIVPNLFSLAAATITEPLDLTALPCAAGTPGAEATAVAVSGTAAFYLAAHTDFGWVFGLGLASMASAWMISTTLATIAICLRRVEQHREWMIRSYVVTFGFVTFRILESILDMAKIGTILERKAAASWFSWTVPLLLTELILQGRKIFAGRISAVQPRAANGYTAVPAPAAFDVRNSESFYQHLR